MARPVADGGGGLCRINLDDADSVERIKQECGSVYDRKPSGRSCAYCRRRIFPGKNAKCSSPSCSRAWCWRKASTRRTACCSCRKANH